MLAPPTPTPDPPAPLVEGDPPPPPVALVLGPLVGFPGNGALFVTPNQPSGAFLQLGERVALKFLLTSTDESFG